MASLLYLAGVKEVTRTLQAITRDRSRMLDYLPLMKTQYWPALVGSH